MARTPSAAASRRSFLRQILVLGGAATVLGRTRGAEAASPAGQAPSGDQTSEGSRYRLTPHIRRYYETASR